jgi:hypothetical protein
LQQVFLGTVPYQIHFDQLVSFQQNLSCISPVTQLWKEAGSPIGIHEGKKIEGFGEPESHIRSDVEHCLKVGLTDGQELPHSELGADEVSTHKEAVGEHIQQAGLAGQGRLLLVSGQGGLSFHRPALPVVTVKGQT